MVRVRFQQEEVVLGISSQRAMVRQLEMPEMDEAELGSALRYEIGELLPIPVEQAVFDFAVLGPGKPKADEGPLRSLSSWHSVTSSGTRSTSPSGQG